MQTILMQIVICKKIIVQTKSYKLNFIAKQKFDHLNEFGLQFLNCHFMSLKVSPQIFKWLQSMSIVKEAKRNNDFLQLSQQISQKFFDGIQIVFILKNYCKHILDQQSSKKFQGIKQNSNPAIRLYNWNILIQLMKKLKIVTLDSSQKSKIVNFDSQPVFKVLKALHDLRQKPNQGQKKGLKVQISEMQKKTILQTNNSMEFLIFSLSKNFKLSPQHTLNLFIDNNKYLSHLLVKGVKNNFNPIYDFLDDIRNNEDHLISQIFCVDEQQNVNFFFNALKSCLISKDQMTIVNCLDVWMNIHMTYKIKSISTQFLKKWIKSQGINTLFFTLTKNSQFFQQIIQICYAYLGQQLFQFFQNSERCLLWGTQRQKLNFFRKLITISNTQICSKFLSSPFIQEWLKYFAKINKKLKDNQQLNEMNLIFQNLWLLMDQKFEDEGLSLNAIYLQFLKQILISQNYLLFTNASVSLFNLIKILGLKKNPNAPTFYRAAVVTFNNLSSVEEGKISLYSHNFISIVKQIQNLPGSLLIPSIIKHLNAVPNSSLIQLSQVLFSQKRVNQQESIQILQILTKIMFQNTIYGEYAIEKVFEIIQTLSDQIGDQYLLSNSKICLANFVSQAKNIIKGKKQLKSEYQYQSKHNIQDQSSKTKDQLINNFNKLLLCNNFIIFLTKYLEVNDINLKNSLEIILFHTYVKVKVQLKKRKVADMLIPLMKRYYQQDQDLQNQITQYEKQNYPEQDQKQFASKISLLKSIKLGKSVDLSYLQSPQLKTIDPSSLKPSTFALKDLEKLKQKKQHFKTIETLKQKQSAQSQSKIKMIRNLSNQKRIIQFGSAGKNDFNYKNLYEFDSMKEEQIVSGVPMIKLINFQKEQQIAHEQDLKSVMKKFRKVWRFLFFKYSTFGAKKQQFKTQQKIHMSQIWKMLRQYQVFTFLKKQQSQMMIKLINDIMKRKNDPQSLTYPGFEQYISQICCYSYNKSQYPHIPSGRQVLLFIQQLKKSTKQKGGSIELFENPQDIYFQETDVIREYNKRIKENPDYILPQGYKKYKQASLQYEYDIHPMLQKNISSSYVDVYEILHQVLLNKLQISLIQPLTLKSEATLVKPMLFQNITEKMKQYKKGYLQPKSILQIKEQNEGQLKKSIVFKKQFHPHINFSLGIKLGLSSVSVKNKTIAEQVAYWMHDMLNAVQNESLKVENAAKKKIVNTIIRKRRVQSLQKIKIQKSQKKNWKKRAESVKVRLQMQKKVKQIQNTKKKEQQVQQKRKKRARQEQSLRNKLNRFQQMKKIMGERKQQQKYKKIQQQDKRKQRLQEYRQKVNEYFQKKKEQILEKQEQLKKQKQQQQKEKQQTKEKKDKFIKQLYMANLKKQQSVLQKADQLKEKYQELWQSEDIEKQFKKYERQLLYLFNLLLKYEKSKISATSFDQIGVNTLHYFALKFMVVPFMVEKTELIKIFNFILKQKQKRLKEKQQDEQKQVKISPSRSKNPGLNFKNFQQSLLLIVIKAKKMLNKIKQKRKKRIQKLLQLIKQKKAQGEDDFNVEELSDSSDQQSSQDEQQEQKAPGLLENYLFNVQDVDEETLQQMFVFLKLPKDKQGVEERYRAAIQSKNLKPKHLLKIELIKKMQTVKVQDIPKQDMDGSQSGSEDE